MKTFIIKSYSGPKLKRRPKKVYFKPKSKRFLFYIINNDDKALKTDTLANDCQ